MVNRHGLIAGATGTGKTKTLQLIAEQLSAAGVPVFLADVKGDLSGCALAGSPTDKLHPVWADEEQRTAAARAARDELEQQVQRDVEALERESAGDWAGEPRKIADRNS